MENGSVVFVTGATGNQGGSVTRHLLRNGFRVIALVRDPGSARAKRLIHGNIEIVVGDLNVPSSYERHLSKADLVFCNLHFNEGVDKEIRQGVQLTSLAKERGVRHMVYSSVIGCDLNTGIPHWESKNIIEKHIRASGLNHTILRPASLYENLLLPQVKSRISKGKLVSPVKPDRVQQFIGADDIGRVSAQVFSDTAKYAGQIIPLASERMDGRQLAALFSEVLEMQVKYQQLPSLITRLFMGKGLAAMFRWVNNNDVLFAKDIEGLKSEFPGMTSLRKWIRDNF